MARRRAITILVLRAAVILCASAIAAIPFVVLVATVLGTSVASPAKLLQAPGNLAPAAAVPSSPAEQFSAENCSGAQTIVGIELTGSTSKRTR